MAIGENIRVPFSTGCIQASIIIQRDMLCLILRYKVDLRHALRWSSAGSFSIYATDCSTHLSFCHPATMSSPDDPVSFNIRAKSPAVLPLCSYCVSIDSIHSRKIVQTGKKLQLECHSSAVLQCKFALHTGGRVMR
jgi:hypothetical protein